ncbi:uncharacterized protein ARMOST_11902 [Armillaria ostoyae]|uniref:Uncharacterized protein n=1 Tax=Armillaria ostoyae TaxID=47428 RepID=A0A284RIJ2_ARMOS|nr:uncharacterized protein ARMOST_11902 [Armillaria ostoyae]
MLWSLDHLLGARCEMLTGFQDCRIACTGPKSIAASYPCNRFFVREVSVTKHVAELTVPSDLDLSIYVHDGIWCQPFLKHKVDLQDWNSMRSPSTLRLVIEVLGVVYGGKSRRTLLMA